MSVFRPAPRSAGESLFWAESRSVYDVPFESSYVAADSIWTRPIGTGAERATAGLFKQESARSSWPGELEYGRVLTDPEYFHLNPNDPVKTLSVTGGGPGHGDGVHVRAGATATGAWNSCAVLLRSADPFTVWQGQPLSLAANGNPSWPWTVPTSATEALDLREGGQRTHLGSHGGSGLSTVGGSIRVGDLSGDDMIHHPLQLGINGLHFLSASNGGYRWPAVTADTGFDVDGHGNEYGGSLDHMLMGVLLALPADYDLSAITEPRAHKICWTLRHYGAYVVDVTDRSWSVFQFSADNRIRTWSADAEWPMDSAHTDCIAFHQQLHGAILDLEAITNNGPGQSAAGGGAPIAPGLFAPPL